MIKKKWTLSIEMSNCGNRYCKQGCFDDDGNKTKNKPHGKYATLVRRSISGHTHVWAKFEKIRLGNWIPNRKAINILNRSDLTRPISEADSNNRPLFYNKFRREFYILLIQKGYDGDKIEGLLPTL